MPGLTSPEPAERRAPYGAPHTALLLIRIGVMDVHKRSRLLGWFSLGLGLPEVVAPSMITRALGTESRPALVRSAYGLREIVAGVGLLTASRPEPWVWARVAGDALDLATLGAVLVGGTPKRRTAAFALLSVAAVTAVDVRTALGLRRADGQS